MALFIALPMAHGGSASAQERRSPSILEFFGIKPAKPRVVILKPQPPKKPVIKNTSARKRPKPGANAGAASAKAAPPASSLAAPTAAAAPEKTIDAKTVMVIGDFLAGELAEGLDAAFAAEAGIRIVDLSTGSSGFVRDDLFDWPGRVASLIAENKPAVIVVMIGANDRQQLLVNAVREPVQSPAWTGEYERRVSAFALALKQSGVPVVWEGLPPFKQKTMSAGILVFNDLYERKATEIGGSFIDIWDGYLDESGAFTLNGFDYTGQPAKLRSSDGINLTSAGKRKAAFYAEKAIRLALGTVPQQPSPSVLGPFALPGPVRPPATLPQNIERIPPISLFDPAFDGSTDLLGGAAPSVPVTGLAATELYINGHAPAPKPGRIDELNIRAALSRVAADNPAPLAAGN